MLKVSNMELYEHRQQNRNVPVFVLSSQTRSRAFSIPQVGLNGATREFHLYERKLKSNRPLRMNFNRLYAQSEQPLNRRLSVIQSGCEGLCLLHRPLLCIRWQNQLWVLRYGQLVYLVFIQCMCKGYKMAIRPTIVC